MCCSGGDIKRMATSWQAPAGSCVESLDLEEQGGGSTSIRRRPNSPPPIVSRLAGVPLAFVFEFWSRLQLVLGCGGRGRPFLAAGVILDVHDTRIHGDVVGAHAEEAADR